MNNLLFAKMRIKLLYRRQKENLFSHRFYEDFCTGYSFILGNRNTEDHFITIEPPGCAVEKALKNNRYYDLSYEFEKVLSGCISSLLRYGRAYLYLQPEYSEGMAANDSNISALELREIVGFPAKRKENKIIFYTNSFTGGVSKKELALNGFIELRITDLDFKKRYFRSIVNRLGKHDATASSTEFISESIDGYDFSEHLKYNQIRILETVRDVGWHFGTDGLTDAYLLYKKIQQDKIKLKFLSYITDKINTALRVLFNEQSAGEIRIHTKNLNYDQLWNDYINGNMTGSELTRVLYQSQ